MKKTIKFFSMAALAMLGAMTVSCSSDNDELLSEQPVNKDNVVTMTLTVNMDEAGTRALAADGTKTFKAGDQIVMIYESNSSSCRKAVSEALAADAGSSATFTVTLTDPKASGSFRIVYPASMAMSSPISPVSDDTRTIDYSKLNTQDGTLASISSSLDIAKYDGNFDGSGAIPTGAINLQNQLAIAKFKINCGGDITSNITKLQITAGDNSYTVNASTLSDIYVAMMPYTGAISINAFTSTKNYGKDVASGTLQKNHITPINLTVTEKAAQDGVALASVTAANLGWVVWSTGYAYDPAKALPTTGTAEGMIGYVGSASDCTHGLAIALEDINGGKLFPDGGKNDYLNTFATAHAVTGGTWRFPSADDFKYMFAACGGTAYTEALAQGQECLFGDIRTMITAAGGTDVYKGSAYAYLLSNTDGEHKWAYTFWDISFQSYSHLNTVIARAVLAF